jgi:hypothetical protein
MQKTWINVGFEWIKVSPPFFFPSSYPIFSLEIQKTIQIKFLSPSVIWNTKSKPNGHLERTSFNYKYWNKSLLFHSILNPNSITSLKSIFRAIIAKFANNSFIKMCSVYMFAFKYDNYLNLNINFFTYGMKKIWHFEDQ